MERKPRKLYYVLPAYNESQNIGRLLNRFCNTMFEAGITNYQIVVVNDGSKDNTIEVLESCQGKMPLFILSHEKNQGLGRTIRDGLEYAQKIAEDDDIVVTMDADDTHTPGLIPRMLGLIREGHDVVIASRYQKGSQIFGLSIFRKIFSYVASLLFRLLLPIQGVKDYTCGFRAYRASVLKKGFSHYGDEFIDQEGFQAMVDIILRLRKFPIVFGEVPFILRYDLKQGDSKMNVQATIFKTLQLIFKRIFFK